MTNDNPFSLVSVNGNAAQSNHWFKIIPPKDVRDRWLAKLKNTRRPSGSLALPAITTTSSLYFSHTLPHSDTTMALGLTTLIVGYDAVITVCRTWIKISSSNSTTERTHNHPARRTA
ncbi:hypothetical protein ACWDO6_21180 [Streptomyces sp. NPDC003674]